MPTAEVLRIDRTYDAPAEAVFDAWTSEDGAAPLVPRRRGLGDERGVRRPPGRRRGAGGDVRPAQKGDTHGGGGRYTEVDRPRRLAFTWVWDGEDRETLIEIEFEPVDGGHRGPLHPLEPARRRVGPLPRMRLERLLRQPRTSAGRERTLR